MTRQQRYHKVYGDTIPLSAGSFGSLQPLPGSLSQQINTIWLTLRQALDILQSQTALNK